MNACLNLKNTNLAPEIKKRIPNLFGYITFLDLVNLIFIELALFASILQISLTSLLALF